MTNRATTPDSFAKIVKNDPKILLPAKGPELMSMWQREHEQYHQRKFQSNLLGARVETLFEMRPKASRIEWVERGNKPKSLEKMSKNKIRILLSALRHGEPTDWESVDRVLFGLECTLRDRAEVAHAWLQAKLNPPPARNKREMSEGTGESKGGGRPRLPDEPLIQSHVPYPEELENQPGLDIIRQIISELRSAGPDQEISLADGLQSTLETVESSRELPEAYVTEAPVAPAKPKKERRPPSAKKKVVRARENAAGSVPTEPDQEARKHSTLRPSDEATGEQPSASTRNAQLAQPMLELRARIGERWQRILVLLGDLGIHEKPDLTEKIFSAKAPSNKIREEINRIRGKEIPEHAKADELLRLLAECDQDAIAIQMHRNRLASENDALIGGFFQEHRFRNYYADVLDFSTRRGAAEYGLLRACDTFDPSEGELSTYAYTWMKSYIRWAAEGERKHTRVSLDKEVGGGESDDAASLLALTEDHRAEQPHDIAHRHHLAEVLRSVVGEMPVQWRRALELTTGLTEDRRTVKPKEAAKIMNSEGIRTMKRHAVITSLNVIQWSKQAIRLIEKKMAHLFAGKKKERPEEALE